MSEAENIMSAKGVTGTLQFDGKTISIERKGGLARMTVGKGSKQIPVSTVSGVQWKPAGMAVSGYIQFSIPGGNEAKSSFGSATSRAVNDENSVVFSKSQEKAFEPIRDAIQEVIAESQQLGQAPTAAATASVADELKKLADLRDAGVLTEEEFQEQKSRLL